MFDHYAIWIFPDSLQNNEPVSTADRLAEAGIDRAFPLLGHVSPQDRKLSPDESEARIETLIAACHERKIQVHGCMDELKFSEFPESMRQKLGDGRTIDILCLANPKVHDHVLERLRYYRRRFNLDGITLEDSYLFQTTTQYDPANSRETAYTTVDGCFCDYCREHAPKEPAAWKQYKQEAVTSLIAKIARECHQGSPRWTFSAAVRMPYQRDFYELYRQEIPYYDGWGHCQSKINFSADWAGWHAAGLVDFVCPMSYFHNARMLELQAMEARERIKRNPSENVWMGLGIACMTAEWFESRKDEFYNTPAKIREELQLLSRLGLRNAVFFSYSPDRLSPDMARVLAELKSRTGK